LSSSSGAPTFAAQFQSANSEHLSVADNSSFTLGDIDFTAVGWVYLDSKSGSVYHLFGQFDTSGNQRSWVVNYEPSNDRFRFIFSSDGTSGNSTQLLADSLGSPKLDTWYMITAWYEEGPDNIYMRINDGPVDAVGSLAGGAHNSTADFTIGAGGTPVGVFLDGRVASVGLWKRKLTESEVNQLWNGGVNLLYNQLPAGLLTSLTSYWNLDELNSTRVDSHGSNDLTDNNTVTRALGPRASEDSSFSSSSSSSP
jgi:hypothetical protein